MYLYVAFAAAHTHLIPINLNSRTISSEKINY